MITTRFLIGYTSQKHLTFEYKTSDLSVTLKYNQ